MEEKNPIHMNASDRQVELLVSALEQAKNNDGYWLNPKGKTAPRIYPRGAVVSPFNGLMMALHSDANGFDTNEYTLFSEAKKRGESVKQFERGVPFFWYNWTEYVNKHDANDKISREDYLQLPREQQQLYKGIKQREIRSMFNIQQTTFPHIDEQRYNKELLTHGTAEQRGFLDKELRMLRMDVNHLIANCRENMVPIRKETAGIPRYDAVKDAIYMPEQKSFTDYHSYVNELTRQMVSATGHPERLARKGAIASSATEDNIRQERLIMELSAGVKALEYGIPAKLSHESMQMVDYWTRELREDRCLIDAIETDVNNAMSMIHKVERGEKIEKNTASIRKETSDMREQLPKHFFIFNEIKDIPNTDTKQFVVVRDKEAKTVDVVLPDGAANWLAIAKPGMSKERIQRALENEGFMTVKFYNPDGALGYRRDDSFFANKEVSIGKMNNWRLEDVAKLDVSDAVKQASSVNFDRIMMIKDMQGAWNLLLKPENQPTFGIMPDKADTNRFFTSLKQGGEMTTDQLRNELAQKYFALAQKQPELKRDLFKFEEAEGADFSLIQRVNIFKTKPDAEGKGSKILCLPSIKGMTDIKPREVTSQQWQLMWLADNKQDYKVQLAAALFADVLKKSQPLDQSVGEKQDAEVETKQNEEAVKQTAEAEQKQKESPRLEQYKTVKEKHADAIVLLRIGDFYECYDKDAEKAASTLGITLTKSPNLTDAEGKEVGMAAFPAQAIDNYLPKLVRAGHRVAICEDISNNRQQDQSAEQGQEQVAEQKEEQQSSLKR